MRVAKFAARESAASVCLSGAFDRVVVEDPLPFSRIELYLDRNGTSIRDDAARLCIDSSAAMFGECDKSVAEAAVRFELLRLLEKTASSVPRLTEDVLVGREMIRKGFSGCLASMLQAFIACHAVTDLDSYVKLNLPWIIFFEDEFHRDFFMSLAGRSSDSRYGKAAKDFFSALQSDLGDEKNLAKAAKLEDDMHAGREV